MKIHDKSMFFEASKKVPRDAKDSGIKSENFFSIFPDEWKQLAHFFLLSFLFNLVPFVLPLY